MRASLFRFWHRKFPPELRESEKKYLHDYSWYYRALHQSEKKRFEHRLAVTLRWLRIRTHRIPEIKPEMPIVVGAGITQVSFGLKRYLFRRFRKIQIVPDVYTYPGMEHMRMVGDTNRMNWMISLSWPHVIEGFRNPSDSYNVVIHEIAHGLEWEHLLGRQRIRAFFKHNDFTMWRRMAAKKLQVIRNGENQFLKNYGGTNMGELFAVSMEAFFEQPTEFQRRLPELYRQMCLLLNQDPRNQDTPVLIPRGV